MPPGDGPIRSCRRPGVRCAASPPIARARSCMPASPKCPAASSASKSTGRHAPAVVGDADQERTSRSWRSDDLDVGGAAVGDRVGHRLPHDPQQLVSFLLRWCESRRATDRPSRRARPSAPRRSLARPRSASASDWAGAPPGAGRPSAPAPRAPPAGRRRPARTRARRPRSGRARSARGAPRRSSPGPRRSWPASRAAPARRASARARRPAPPSVGAEAPRPATPRSTMFRAVIPATTATG